MRKKNIYRILYVLFILTMIAILSFMASDLKRKEELRNKYETHLVKYNNISVDDYFKLLDKDDISLVYIGRDSCRFCMMQNGVLKNLMDKYNIKVNFINTNKLKDNDTKRIAETYDDFKENGLGTPTVLLVGKKEIIMYKRGFVKEEELTKALKEYNFI